MRGQGPLLLVILDGWGYADTDSHNAIQSANTPNWDRYWKTMPHSLIACAGNAVGLPEGQMGNSEVGHMHIGAGRTIYQDFTRIDKAIETGDFDNNAPFLAAMDDCLQQDKALHILGLLSPGGVHSHERHIQALIKLAAKRGLKKIYLHAFLDGRDTPPKSALPSIQAIEACFEACHAGQFASLTGRYFAMDRDQRWDRVKTAYDCIVNEMAPFQADSAEAALMMAYQRDETDEFVQATLIGEPGAAIQAGDSVVFMNFRADRARQLSYALTQRDFTGFDRAHFPSLSHFISLTRYASDIDSEIAFAPQSIKNSLGECLAENELSQLRIAETEKYAHVTFFFNGGSEQVFSKEERILIPSPKVATYNLQPEMSAPELTLQMSKAIESNAFDVIICNYANPDMVGHTGDFPATLKALECIDDCLGQLETSLGKVGGEMLITADHGNAEQMFDDTTGQAHTAHTSTPVPFVFIGRDAKMRPEPGSLIDIAPTMLYLLGLEKPEQMTGTPLLTLET